LNIEDLPNFVRLAANLGVDKVICYYNYIYIPTQKYLSCFFKQEFTNKMLNEAEELASKLKIEISLPPKFGQKEYPQLGPCREPFSQVMFDSQGRVLPCDASEDCHEILGDGKDFMDIWNGPYYQNLRKSLLEGTSSCFKHCLRANPSSVNDFKSHVIYRGGRRDEDIHILWGDNF
jgi:MoaA/NifB/PqqE/SkfB family radical SAM enzyme